MTNDTVKIIAILAVAWLIFGQGSGTQVPPGDDDDDGISNGNCNYAPTFSLRANDKWDSVLLVSSGHLYQIDGGDSATYAGTAISANKGAKIDVLWGQGNSSRMFKDVGNYVVKECGLNQLPENGPFLLVQNTSVTVECFDENNDIINDVTQNFTIGSGETASIPCRLKVDNSKKGIPHGAVLIAEIATGTVYKEEKTTISGGPIVGPADVPSAFALSAAANKAVAFEVSPLMATGYQPFTVYVEAENAQNPNNANDITLYLYSKNCYENSDNGKYECGVENEDSAYVGSMIGSEVISID